MQAGLIQIHSRDQELVGLLSFTNEKVRELRKTRELVPHGSTRHPSISLIPKNFSYVNFFVAGFRTKIFAEILTICPSSFSQCPGMQKLLFMKKKDIMKEGQISSL